MHTKFGFSYNGPARTLDLEEHVFRAGAMFEEVIEYMEATFELDGNDFPKDKKELLQSMREAMKDLGLKKNINKAEQMDALFDLIIFAVGTLERQGFSLDEGIERVMKANMQKEVAGSANRSKRDYEFDLVKPKGWSPPDLSDLVELPKGLIILDGPDGCGKTTLAEKLCEMYDGHYIHHTWSPELQTTMDTYLTDGLENAIEMSKDRLVVIDRLWLSEVCYSEGIREGSEYPDLHKKLFDRIKEVKALNIFCFPNHIKRGLERFEELKSERPEHYDNIEQVFYMYFNLYYGGVYAFQKPTDFLNRLTSRPLFTEFSYMRYDFEVQGKDLNDLCQNTVIPLLKQIQES